VKVVAHGVQHLSVDCFPYLSSLRAINIVLESEVERHVHPHELSLCRARLLLLILLLHLQLQKFTAILFEVVSHLAAR
jgi:hypothetical protein